MKNITAQMTLGEIVTEVPKAGDMMRKLRVDFANEGGRTLQSIGEAQQLPLENLLYEINQYDTENMDGIDVKYMDEESLIKYIQRKYHEDLKDELPVLEEYVEKMTKENRALEEVETVFLNLKTALLDHTRDEDDNVFPMLKEFMATPSAELKEALKPHLTELEDEHRNAVEAFWRMRDLTNDFTPEEGDSGIIRFVYQRMEKLEKDTLDHVHLENNILFKNVREEHYE
ncbi:hemerythrin domain-containing protein [Salinicoccus siamensis]|uniref:Hemerythrin domain-containing protein n=1 Tax=Salinicoccus siamensis TaxID=381830 RepID=A0ABV5Z0D4_9STAP